MRWLTALAVLLGGCYFLFVHPPQAQSVSDRKAQRVDRMATLDLGSTAIAEDTLLLKVVSFPAAQADTLEQDDWRRTVDGWERASTWDLGKQDTLPTATRIHPGLVASLQLLLSIGSLLAFSHRATSSNEPGAA